MRLYLAIGVLAVLLGLGGYAWFQQSRAAELAHKVDNLKGEIEVKDRQIAQALVARSIADAEATRQRSKARELDQLKESLLKGGDDA